MHASLVHNHQYGMISAAGMAAADGSICIASRMVYKGLLHYYSRAKKDTPSARSLVGNMRGAEHGADWL
jgi:hypothetical protein